MATELQAALLDMLRGYGQRNADALDRLADFTDWQRVAQAEMEHRATRIVKALDDETLRAIAAGWIDFNEACRAVAQDLAPKVA